MARIFEQGGDVTPNLARRVAWGLAGVATANSTWQTIVDWLLTVLGFLKIDENLADLNDVVSAQANLDVYPQALIDVELALKADKSNVLQKDNTTTYVPITAYNPATKLFAESLAQKFNSVQSLTNAGGASTGSPTTLDGSKDLIFLTQTASNRFYVIGTVGAVTDKMITIKNKASSTTDITIVANGNNDLPVSNSDIRDRGSVSFVFDGSKWNVLNEYSPA